MSFKKLFVLFSFTIFFLVILLFMFGCATTKKPECTYYCPYDGNKPLDCYCLEDMTDQTKGVE